MASARAVAISPMLKGLTRARAGQAVGSAGELTEDEGAADVLASNDILQSHQVHAIAQWCNQGDVGSLGRYP